MVATLNFDAIYQGDDWQRTIQLQETDGDVVDLTGATFRMQFRSPFSKSLYTTLTMGNGIDFSNNLITLTLTEEQVSLFVMRTVIYDLEMTWPNGIVTTLFKGEARVQPDITKPDQILPGDYLADFSDEANSMYGFLFTYGIGFEGAPPGPISGPYADFSLADNSEYGFLFNLGISALPVISPNAPQADFSSADNSGYIALLSLA